MQEHEQLKEICDLIGYEDYQEYGDRGYGQGFYEYRYCDKCEEGSFVLIDVREIIFDPIFMDKLVNYLQKEGKIIHGDENDYPMFLIRLHRNLNNPVQYLYNLLITGKE